MCSLQQLEQQLTVNTLALLSPPHSTSQTASSALQQPAHILYWYDQKLAMTSPLMLAYGEHRSDPVCEIAMVSNVALAVMNLVDDSVAGGNAACCLTPRGKALH